jgi:hypothetical protein
MPLEQMQPFLGHTTLETTQVSADIDDRADQTSAPQALSR